MTTPGPEEFETHDIYLAAYFKVSGCILARKRRQGQRVFLIFTNPGGPIRDLRYAFYSGSAKVDPHAYSREVIAMKQVVHDV
jgi:hypothetical protein